MDPVKLVQCEMNDAVKSMQSKLMTDAERSLQSEMTDAKKLKGRHDGGFDEVSGEGERGQTQMQRKEVRKGARRGQHQGGHEMRLQEGCRQGRQLRGRISTSWRFCRVGHNAGESV